MGFFGQIQLFQKNEKKVLTFLKCRCIIIYVVTATAADKGAEVVRKCGSLAQLGEHLPYKQRVTGSSPVGPILLCIN